MMSRSVILEAMYEVIKDSTEWGVSEKDYGMFVDGIVAMTEAVLQKEELIHKNMIDRLRNSGMIGVINDESDVEFVEFSE